MKRIDFKSLSIKLLIYFSILSLTIVTILWVLEIIFLGVFYQGMKVSHVERIGNSISAKYGNADFYDSLYHLSFNNSLSYQLYDENGAVLNMKGFSPFNSDRMIPKQIHKLMEDENTATLCKTLRDDSHRINMVVYAAKLSDTTGNKALLVLLSPLVPVDATIHVLKTQLFIVTIIALVISLVLSFFFARIVTRPIKKITDSATMLATGKYDTVFEKGGYSEVDRLADSLNYAATELSKTDNLRRDLIANVSHDIRTPLTIIKSYAEMIRDLSGNNEEKRSRHTNVIIDETNRLSLLVSDLLDLSKMESGTVRPEMTRFDISGMINEVVNHFRVLSPDNTLLVDAPENVFVTADELQIYRVIYNLITNAVNYSGENSRIVLKVIPSDSKVRVEVTDNGEGIPPEELDGIWDRYYKVSKNSGRTASGSGIGLSIVKNILEMHNAKYGVNSTVGKGSCFWFELEK